MASKTLIRWGRAFLASHPGHGSPQINPNQPWKRSQAAPSFCSAHNQEVQRLASTSRKTNDELNPDILIVGSGGAALTAALRAHHHGLSPLIIESTSLIGGTTSYSGGGLWIPNSKLHPPSVRDSYEEALIYMEAVIGSDGGPASSRGRKKAFLRNGPKMVEFLAKEGFRWRPSTGYPDYYPEMEGGKETGRSIEGEMFDLGKLGDWLGKMRTVPAFPLYTHEAGAVYRAGSSLDGFLTMLKVLGWRKAVGKVFGKRYVTTGQSLVGQLLYLNMQKKTEIWLDSPLRELVVKGGVVVGVVVESDGKSVTVTPSRGVILAAGGFAKNDEMRKKHQASPVEASQSLSAPGDQGDAITAAIKAGAATSLLDEACWGPVLAGPEPGTFTWFQMERSLPHCIIIDQAGNRFTNEAQSYTHFVHDQYAHHKKMSAIPAYCILDSRHRKRYIFASKPPGKPPQAWLDSGFMVQANSLAELAEKTGIDAKGLQATATRFNSFVSTGVDLDFRRGASAYDNFLGDPAYKPNPNLGSIEKPPFYAVKVVPGDLGTKGGVLTDELARALRADGGVIPGLYAAGNTSASVMGRRYIGSGSTLGPALTFAFVAVDEIASTARST